MHHCHRRLSLALGLAILFLPGRLAGQTTGEWTKLVQGPYLDRPTADVGLAPLLVNAHGQPIQTRAEWHAQRDRLRAAWLAILGPAPAKPRELEVRIENREDRDDHTRLLVSFRSEGDDRIRAYLLTPKNLTHSDRRPAVVVFHPTTTDTLREPVGLGRRPEMALALFLVRRGYVTLSPECYIMKGPGPQAQAEALAKRRPGWTGLGKMTFDASRCVDFLETLPNVDPHRVGCIGHSLGAKEVLYAMAFEPRYRAGVFNEGGVGLRMSNWTDPWYLTAAMQPKIPARENHQVLALVAPRAFLVMGGGDADGDASWPFVKAALPIYALEGAAERIGLWNHHGKHSFPAAAQELAFRWLDPWLEHSVLQAGSGKRP